MSAGRIVALVIGAIAGFVAVALFAAGGVLIWAHTAGRGADDFIDSGTYDFASTGHAVVSDQLDLHADPIDPGWVPGTSVTSGDEGGWNVLGDIDVRLRATAPSETAPIFVGIGPTAAVLDYLDGVAYDEVTDVNPGGTVRYRAVEGTRSPAAAPADEDFWVASASGTGEQELVWRVESGDWTAVLMNADGSAGVVAATEAGIDVGFLLPLAAILFGIAVMALVVAAVLVVIGTRRTGAAEAAVPAALPAGASRYPVTLEAQLDPQLSRWQWLVKWFLAIPHFVVLAFLWTAFVLLTVVAGFAILFTGRYPRGIFDFNVGVLRWTWRVSYYATSVLGTDRYPPFSLQPADYPATLEIAYPESLSRGLVLVKWWLLAIPHYIIVGILIGNLVTWTVPGDNGTSWELAVGGGLIGLLSFIAVLVMAFAGRYPAGLFDLLMGFNRWTYRVIAYAALMRDEYPPFRLDQGGSEPPATPPPPPPSPGVSGTDRELTPA